MVSQVLEWTGNAFEIDMETAKEIRIDGSDGVAIRLAWDGLNKQAEDKIRERIMADVKDTIQKREKDLKKEKERCVKHMRSLTERFVELLREFNENNDELTLKYIEALPKMEELEDERIEQELNQQIKQERCECEKRMITIFKEKQRKKTNTYVFRTSGKTAEIQRQILENIPDDKLRETLSEREKGLKKFLNMIATVVVVVASAFLATAAVAGVGAGMAVGAVVAASFVFLRALGLGV